MAETREAGSAQENINAYWDFRSQSYDSDPGHGIQREEERQAWLRALGDLLPAAPADVLDVGTGTGFLAFLLADAGHRVTGIDLSEGMLAIATARAVAESGNVATVPSFRVGNAVEPPLPPASVDVVISRHLLWTLTDPTLAFANWRRLLRPGGRVVAIDGLWSLRQSPPAGGTSGTSGTSSTGGAASTDSAFASEQTTDGDDAKERQRAAWDRLYSGTVQAELPLFGAKALEAVLDAIKAAGFGEPRVTDLADVERIEEESLPPRPPDRGPRLPRFVITVLAGEEPVR